MNPGVAGSSPVGRPIVSVSPVRHSLTGLFVGQYALTNVRIWALQGENRAKTPRHRLRPRFSKTAPTTTGGLPLLFVIQHADAIAALSATPVSRRQLRPRFSEIYRCHMFEARGNPKSPLIRSNQAALNTAPYLSLPVDAISMRGGKPSSRNDLPHFPQGRRRRNHSLSISGTP